MTLKRIGWKPVSAACWRDREGRNIDLKVLDSKSLGQLVEHAEQAHVWSPFGKKYSAPSLAGGAYTAPLKQAHAAMLAKRQYMRAGKFIAAVSGTEWTQYERFTVGLTADPRCQFRLSFDGTLAHWIQGCPERVQGGPQEPLRLLTDCRRGKVWAAEHGLAPDPAVSLRPIPEPTESWVIRQ